MIKAARGAPLHGAEWGEGVDAAAGLKKLRRHSEGVYTAACKSRPLDHDAPASVAKRKAAAAAASSGGGGGGAASACIDISSRTVIFVVKKEVGLDLAFYLRQDAALAPHVHEIYGGEAAARRGATLARCDADPNAVLVATRSSMGCGYSLTSFRVVLNAEGETSESLWKQGEGRVLRYLAQGVPDGQHETRFHVVITLSMGQPLRIRSCHRRADSA